MQAARLLDVLLTGLLLLAFLHRCDAAPATSSAVASKALPSVVPPDRSALKEDAWAARFVYNVIQRNANNTAKRALVNRRDDSDLDYAATLSHDDKDLYLIYPWRGDKALPYVAQLVVTNVTLGKGSQGHVYDGYLYQYPDEDTEDKDEDCDGDYVPVAVKVSAGSGDYRSARTFANIQSQYIVKVRQYALKYPENGVGSRVESIVAYEILQESAFNAWVLGTIDQVPFMKAAMKGAIDAARQDVWIMDLKFENYMSKTKAVGADAEWAVVDLGMIVKGDCFAYSEGYAGTYGYMPPEMLESKLVPDGQSAYQAGPAQVFNIAIMFLYLQNGIFEGTVTQDMRDISTKLYKRQLHDRDYRWHWIALLVAYVRREDSPSKIPLPSKYTDDPKYEAWARFYRKSLCREGDRYLNTISASYELDRLI